MKRYRKRQSRLTKVLEILIRFNTVAVPIGLVYALLFNHSYREDMIIIAVIFYSIIFMVNVVQRDVRKGVVTRGNLATKLVVLGALYAFNIFAWIKFVGDMLK